MSLFNNYLSFSVTIIFSLSFSTFASDDDYCQINANALVVDDVRCCQSVCNTKFGDGADADVPHYYESGRVPESLSKGGDENLQYMGCLTLDHRICGYGKSTGISLH